jgi:hypothetical protein
MWWPGLQTWCPVIVVPGLPGSHEIVVVAVTVSQPRCGSNGCENTSCSAVAVFPVEDVFTVVADAGGHRATCTAPSSHQTKTKKKHRTTPVSDLGEGNTREASTGDRIVITSKAPSLQHGLPRSINTDYCPKRKK